MSKTAVILEDLSKNIGSLLDRSASLNVEKEKLIEENLKLKNLISERENNIAELTQQYKVLKMAKSLSGTEEKTSGAKLKINELMREIDKCIALLNK